MHAGVSADPVEIALRMEVLAWVMASLLRIAASGTSLTLPTLIQAEKTQGETAPVGLMAAWPVPHWPQRLAGSGA